MDNKMIKKSIVIVMGSHRSNGNTHYLVHNLVDRLNTLALYPQVIDVNTLNIKHCIDCNICKENWGQCVHDDDMTDVYALFKQADVLIIASPVYFNGVTSKLKTLIDRCQMIFLCDFEHHKPFVEQVNPDEKLGFVFSIGGANTYPHQFMGNELTIKLVFDNLRVPLTNHLKYFGTDHQLLVDRSEVSKDLDEIVKDIEAYLMP